MRTILFYIFLNSFFCFSQNGLSLHFDLSQFVHWNVFTETNFSIGTSIKKSKLSIIPTLQYQFGGNFKISWPNDITPAYGMNYHLIGLGTKVRFLEDRIYSPSVEVRFLKEIASNYAGRYLKSSQFGYNYNFAPSNNFNIDYSNQGSIDHYAVTYYVSTPLILVVSFGNEFRITKGLYANLSIGYSARGLTVRRKFWSEGEIEPQSNILGRHSISDLDWKHYLDLSLGLSYTFPLKKKE